MTTLKQQTCPRRFAVIGAGAAGLATLKVLLDEIHDHVPAGDCEIVGFEQRKDVGGVWLPDPHPELSQAKWPETPLYDSLTTNTPHPIMLYPSYLAAPSTPLFTTPQVINDYIRSYVNRFNLRQYIRFNSPVTAATWDHPISQWKITYEHLGSGVDGQPTKSVSYFDYLLVANGRNRCPFIPNISGLRDWTSSGSRNYMHSVWYRNPEPYRGHNVLIIGGGRSGVDLSEAISLLAKKTVHSVRSLEDQDFERILQRGDISHFSSDGFVNFKNAKREYVDRIIFATGYHYDYSFLTQLPTHEPQATSDHLYSSGFHIYPLALHMFPLQGAFPPTSMAFIGIPKGITVFTMAEVQATLAVRQMMGRISLDFEYELLETIKRNGELRQECTSALDVARRIHWFDHTQSFEFLDLLRKKACDSRRIPVWKRELMPDAYVMRAQWQELESLGLAESWVNQVGEGGIEEWVGLMERVLSCAKDKQMQGMVASI